MHAHSMTHMPRYREATHSRPRPSRSAYAHADVYHECCVAPAPTDTMRRAGTHRIAIWTDQTQQQLHHIGSPRTAAAASTASPGDHRRAAHGADRGTWHLRRACAIQISEPASTNSCRPAPTRKDCHIGPLRPDEVRTPPVKQMWAGTLSKGTPTCWARPLKAAGPHLGAGLT